MGSLELDSIRLEQTEVDNTLRGMVAGRELYFRAPATFELDYSANPFVVAMLIPAMQRGIDILIPDEFPISATLLKSLDELQTILSFWHPTLKRISIKATASDAGSGADSSSKVACLFSGGLDACYTLVKHAEVLTHLVYVRGIDLQLDNERIFEICSRKNQEIARYMGKELIVVESNIRFFIRELESTPLSWYINQAGGLASIALVLKMSRVLISSSNSYDALHPLGSHPLTDPMWSTESTRIVHTGCEKRRHEKLEVLAAHDPILQRIRVCWHDKEFNCGVCDKCVHYRMALTIMNLDVEGMPRLASYRNLFGAHVLNDGEFAEWRDNLLLALKYDDRKAAKAVNRLLNRYRIRKALKLLDEALTGGRLRSLKSKIGL